MPDLVEITSPSGVRLTVAKDAADAFSGLLSDLEGQGYRIDQRQVGGYNPRNIAGTNTPSLHSYGHAIDINSAWNQRGANTDSDMPPNIADLAAKRGLTWGGAWSGDTRDPMHFEYHPGAKPVAATATVTAPSADDLLARMNKTAPSPSTTPSSIAPTPTPDQATASASTEAAPSSDDLLARMNKAAPPPPTAAEQATAATTAAMPALPPPQMPRADTQMTTAQVAKEQQLEATANKSGYFALEPKEPGFNHLLWSLGAPFFAIGQTALGERPLPTGVNALEMAAPLAGAGDLRFSGPTRPGMPGVSSYDRGTLRDPGTQQDIARAYFMARNQGIDLTPGQSSGLPSLLNLEDVYASGSAGPRAADLAQKFYSAQRQQVVGAFDRAAENISPTADKTDAALQFQQGAEDAQRIVRQQANQAAKPSYDAARAAGQVLSPDLAQLMDVPAVKTAMDAARKEYPNMPDTRGKTAPDTPDFDLWDLTKRKLDDAHTAAKQAGENTTASAIDGLRKDLLTQLDTAYPTYAEGRATAAPGLREAARLADVVGKGGELGTEKLRAILNPVFESSNPRAIESSRDSFIKAGKEDEWNAGVRAYVQDIFDKTTESQDGLNPSMLRRQLWGNTNKRDAIRAAMDPDAFQGLENFMGTLENVARSRGMNSLTAPRQAGANALQEAAGNTTGVRAIGLLKGLSAQRLLDIPGRAADVIQGWMIKRNMNRIGDYLFSQNGQRFLREMAGYPSGTDRAMTMTGQFLGQQGGLLDSSSRQKNLLTPP